MKLGPVTKLNKRNKKKTKKKQQKKLMMMFCQEILMSLSFFQFMAYLEESGSWILGA